MDEDGAVEFFGDESFLVAAEIVAEFGGIAVFVQDGNRVFVG